MTRELQDHYFRQAKRDGYVSRAAYKLIETDDKRKVLRKGDCVLDCGCAPGSWLQVALQRVGPKGRVVGIDRSPIHQRVHRTSNLAVLQDDLYTVDPAALRAAANAEGDGPCFDAIISDLAPATTGDRTIDHHGSVRLCERVLELCTPLLRPKGRLLMKVLEGEAYPDLIANTKRHFEKVKGFKPAASRRESTEMYIVADGHRPGAADAAEAEADEHPPLPKRPRPTGGWGAKN